MHKLVNSTVGSLPTVRQGDLTSRLTCDGNINDDFDRNLIQNFKGGEKKTLKIYQHFRPFLRHYCLKTYIRSNDAYLLTKCTFCAVAFCQLVFLC